MTFFGTVHQDFHHIVHDFVQDEILSQYDEWESAGSIPKQLWKTAAERGIIGLGVDSAYGGMGIDDWRFRLIVIEELGFAGAASVNTIFAAHDDLAVPAVAWLGTDDLKSKWLPGMATGDVIGATGLTEPGAGSDLRAIRAKAKQSAGGWLLNGQKAFVSNGHDADLVVIAAKTDPGSDDLTLFAVDGQNPGLERGRHLDKIGLHAADTAELFLTDCRVDAGSVLGDVGRGRDYLRSLLRRQRLAQAAISWAGTKAALKWTEDHVFERRAFGQRIGDFQNTRFALADIDTRIDITASYLRDCVVKFNSEDLSDVEAAKAKWWASENEVASVSRLLQFFGGYGYSEEYPIARAFRDSRVHAILGGATEVMKEIIGRNISGRYR